MANSIYFGLQQPEIKYTVKGIPPLGWKFTSFDELEHKVKVFARRSGFEFFTNHKYADSSSYHCSSGRRRKRGIDEPSICPVTWRAKKISVTNEFIGEHHFVYIYRTAEEGHNHELASCPPQDPAVLLEAIWIGVLAGPLRQSDFAIPLMYPSMLELDQKLVMELRDRGKSNFIEPDDVESIVWAFEPLLLALSATVQNAHFKLRNTVTWSSRLFKNLDNALADATSNSRKLILLGTIQTPLSPPEGTPDFDKYRRYINLRMEANRYIRAYPTPEEMEFATNKVGDLRILRECADEFRAEGMSWLAHRPATCDGGLSGRCTLPPSLGNYKEMVIKPIRSSCGKDIRVTEVEDRKGLKCYLPNGKPTGLNPEKHSFHQEYIKPLSDFGEFRIIIARDTSKEAMDGLLPPGKIINIVLTRPNGSSQDRFSDTSVTRFEPACFGSGFGDEEAQKRKSEELRKFALVWYAKLLELSYSYPGLASVQVGLRLDVGLSEVTVDGRFFINEMTRFWSASSYSEGSDTAVQRAWGQAWGFICTQDQYWS